MKDQPQTRQFNLIRGAFSPEEAASVLMNLLEHKINFHRGKNWSHKERFNLGDPDSETRIEELRQTKEALSRLLQDADSAGSPVTIHCDIHITRTAR